ncbi:hypothetical protein P364_0121535 [Paenibacillus sp. MAEPY2]|nr:hypothetical protein P364_0121535 [Paenibacillus sp. MAEPY2]KGP89488.1 hypothetical protein P363_0100755 [Paenibacillus sp. MAEPY1]
MISRLPDQAAGFAAITMNYICSTKHLPDNGEDRKNLEKRSVRLYPRIFPFGKKIKKSGDKRSEGCSVIVVASVNML